jgi:hypothetical protein
MRHQSLITRPAVLRPLGPFYALPSETNKYVHIFLASPVTPLRGPYADDEIEKYFDMSVVQVPFADAVAGIGTTIHGLETEGGLLLARRMLDER